jgi:hypothetical protein
MIARTSASAWPVVRIAASILMAVAALSTAATVLDTLLRELPPQHRTIVAQADKFQLQILYTQINRDKLNQPHFVRFAFNVNPKRYFYPASLVKLPVAALALEKIHRLHRPGLTCKTQMRIASVIDCPIGYDSDEESPDMPHGRASVASSVERMLLASDNKAFNRLWDFLTRDYANDRLFQCGFTKTALLHRLSPCSIEQNRLNNPVAFLGSTGKIIYKQPLTHSLLPDANPLSPIDIGSARMGYGMLIPQSMHADNLNYLPIEEAHRFLIGLMFPNSVDKTKRLALTPEDYRLLRTWLCLLPSESGMHRYESPKEFPDNYKKYLFFGDGKQPCTPTLREFNVIGRAYGFMVDVAYFADFTARIEFFLSAVIYVNDDGIINDNIYEYDAVALPFFSALGAAVYNYEKKRPRSRKPDLRAFEPVLPQTKR